MAFIRLTFVSPGGFVPGGGDVVGPAGSNDGTIVLFDGITGKLIKDSGILPNAFVGDSGLGGVIGFVPAPAAGDAAANKFLSADGTWKILPGIGASYHTPFTNADLLVGILTIVHGLGVRYNTWAIYDNNNSAVLNPDSALSVNINTIAFDLSTYQLVNGGAIPGIWNVVVQS